MNSEVDNSIKPILEHFEILGLNGYKNLAIHFADNVKIIAAENGSGKTTLLNTLHTVLSRNFYNLRNLSFSQIRIKLKDHELITIGSDDVGYLKKAASDQGSNSNIIQELHRYGLSFDEVLGALVNYDEMSHDDFRRTSEFMTVWELGPWSYEGTILKFREAASEVEDRHPAALQRISLQLKTALGDLKVLYLPTYRRIETQAPEQDSGPRSPSKARPRRRPLSDDSASANLLNFGLDDVREKLQEITSDIRQQTATAYSSISGRTLDQLLTTGKFEELVSSELNIQNLGVVLARLGKSDLYERLSGLIESGDIDLPRNNYLRYFLTQLLEIHRATQSQEEAIENFVTVVASYWNSGVEEKVLHYDKVSLRVSVENVYTRKELNLNALSSGEKQMMSMFAKIYLNPGQKYIVLIDEPELSLSIDWQRRLLPDIDRADSCTQLLAITHSPFVFDNELDQFAGSLKVEYLNNIEQPE